MKKSILFAALLFTCISSLHAQEKNLISGNFVQSTFDDFINKIESQTDYTFYYDRKNLDSLRITIEVKSVFLSSLLNKVFEKTQFEYSIDKSNNIFISIF